MDVVVNVGAMPSVGNDPNDGFCDVANSSKVSLNGWRWRMDAYKIEKHTCTLLCRPCPP